MIYKKLKPIELSLAVITTTVIILFYLFFNFNYLSNWIDEKGDAKTYDHYVKMGIPKFLYNPHHLAFDWTGEKLYKVFLKSGYTGSSMMILQLRNLVFSACSLGLIFFFFYKISKKYLLSLLLVLMMAFSCAVWIYSQINDTPIIHSMMLMLLFFALIYFPAVKHKLIYAFFLGVFHSIDILFHQSDLIFFFVIAFVILLADNFLIRPEESAENNAPLFFKKPLARRHGNATVFGDHTAIKNLYGFHISHMKSFLIYFLTMIFCVAIAYYYVGIVLIKLTLDPAQAEDFNSFKNSTYFFNWLILYTKINYWGKGYEGNTIQKVLHGIATYFYQPQNFQGQKLELNLNQLFAPNTILPNLVFIFLSGILMSSISLIILLFKKYRYVFIANLIFLVIYIIFACWWEPDYREFWVAPMIAFWLLALFVLNYILDKTRFFHPVPGIAVYSLMFIIILLLFYFNFTGFIYPHASDQHRQFDIILDINARK